MEVLKKQHNVQFFQNVSLKSMHANTQDGCIGIHFVMGAAVWRSLANSVSNLVTYGTSSNKTNLQDEFSGK